MEEMDRIVNCPENVDKNLGEGKRKRSEKKCVSLCLGVYVLFTRKDSSRYKGQHTIPSKAKAYAV